MIYLICNFQGTPKPLEIYDGFLNTLGPVKYLKINKFQMVFKGDGGEMTLKEGRQKHLLTTTKLHLNI